MKKIMFAILSLFLLSACGNEAEDTKESDIELEQLEIYTTVYPLQYFAERIGGDRVSVHSIYPPGANEHTFEPTQADMIKLAEADAVFYIGLGLEGFIDNAQNTLQNEKVKFVATAEDISKDLLQEGHSHDEHHEHANTTDHNHGEEVEQLEEHSHENETVHEHTEEHLHDEEQNHEHTEGHAHDDESAYDHEEHEETYHEDHEHHYAEGEVDPHVWISPLLSQKLAESIKNELIALDEEGTADYEKNYELLVKDLEELHQSFEDMAKDANQTTFFVSHAAFGYLAETYGLTQVPVAGINSSDEPSQKELVGIVEEAQRLGVKYIAFEQNVSSHLTEIIQNEIGAESVQLHNLSVLTQEEIDRNENYLTLMKYNLETLEKILNY
nr:zinc ABC transporter substrate-binding protein [Lysinibacillus timonensis]